MVSAMIYILIAAGAWRIFEKMGREGWEGIIPFYNLYVLFDELYGSGWKMLLLLIPIYNIYVAVKFNIDLSHAFHLHGAYAIGLLFLPVVFYPVLGFGDAVYLDGNPDRNGDNMIKQELNKLSSQVSRTGEKFRRDDAIEQIRKLDDLRKSGILTDEEFQSKKAELLSRI